MGLPYIVLQTMALKIAELLRRKGIRKPEKPHIIHDGNLYEVPFELTEPQDPYTNYGIENENRKRQTNWKLLERGRLEMERYQYAKRNQITDEYYQLLKKGIFSPANILSIDPKVNSKAQAEEKYIYIKKRYILDEEKVLIDTERNNRMVCRPKYMYNNVMANHLKHHHMSIELLHRNLVKYYSNISYKYVTYSIRYCNVCSRDKKKYLLNFNTESVIANNIRAGLLPFERLQVEIFKPFGSESKIEGKYRYILYLRDFSSRYIWTIPLLDNKSKTLRNSLTEFLLSVQENPIFLHTSTLEQEDMFDIVEYITDTYKISLGLGTFECNIFLQSGIQCFKALINLHKNECLESWNKFIIFGPRLHNNKFNRIAMGIPSNLVDCNSMNNHKKSFRLRRSKIIRETSANNLVKLQDKMSVIYVEDSERSKVQMLDLQNYDEEAFGDEYESDIEGDLMSNASDVSVEFSIELPSVSLKSVPSSRSITAEKSMEL